MPGYISCQGKNKVKWKEDIRKDVKEKQQKREKNKDENPRHVEDVCACAHTYVRACVCVYVRVCVFPFFDGFRGLFCPAAGPRELSSASSEKKLNHVISPRLHVSSSVIDLLRACSCQQQMAI